MKLTKEILGVLKQFSTINTNVVIKPGKKFSTISMSNDVMAEYEGDVDFDKTVSIYNLNEFLGVISSFNSPDIELDDKFMTITEGKQTVKYMYAEECLLYTPKKSIKLPSVDVSFELSAAVFSKLQKMTAILGVEDLAFTGDGTKIVAKVFDSKNPSGNEFELDLESSTSEVFTVLFKTERMKLLADQDFDIEISSQKISKFTCKGLKLTTFVAIETSSTFGV